MKVYGPVSRYQKRQISDALNVGTYTVQRTLKYPRRNRCLTSPHLTSPCERSAVQCSAVQRKMTNFYRVEMPLLLPEKPSSRGQSPLAYMAFSFFLSHLLPFPHHTDSYHKLKLYGCIGILS
jgi:hypothetical protein